MNIEQYNILRAARDEDKLHAADFAAGGERTLVYGYTVERYTFHVYLKDSLLHRHVYDGQRTIAHRSGPALDIWDVNPGKRAYPERCDYDFIRAFESMGGTMSFTHFNEEAELAEEPHFYGNIA